MTGLPIEQWQTSLAEMEHALGAVMQSLERLESRFAGLDRPRDPAAAPLDEALFARLEDRFQEWNRCLAEALDATTAAELLIGRGEEAVGQWRNSFAGLRETIQRWEAIPSSSGAGSSPTAE